MDYACCKYRFEWNDDRIIDDISLHEVLSEVADSDYGVNYDQIARLFFVGNTGIIMVELQAPTKSMMDITEEDEKPWLEAFRVESFDDYDASRELHSAIGQGWIFTYDNVEEQMLQYAMDVDKALFDPSLCE